MSRPLERLQADFADALAHPAATLSIAAALEAGASAVAERLSLYRGNVEAAWEKALANAFPVVRMLVGEEFFAALARAYGSLHPSRDGDLNRFGERFAQFVGAFEHTRSLRYLADVATLEWHVHRAHYAADARALSRAYVSLLAPDQLLSARFELNPACVWLESTFAIASIWQAHRANAEPPGRVDVEQNEHALVVRREWHAEALRSSSGEVAALAQLRAEGDMESAIAAGLHADAAFDFPKALVRWLDYAVLVR